MQQKSSVHAFLPFRPPKYAALAHGRGTGVVRPKAGACGVLSGSLSEGISWVILAFFVGCVKAGGSGARCAARGGGCAAGRSSAGGLQRRVFPPLCAARGAALARGRGALRPLFLLRSCAADQEKRPEKKSWAVTACDSVQLEHLRGTCIRSASRCSSRGQREEGIFWLRGRDFGDGFWELGLWSLCCAAGLCL